MSLLGLEKPYKSSLPRTRTEPTYVSLHTTKLRTTMREGKGNLQIQIPFINVLRTVSTTVTFFNNS